MENPLTNSTRCLQRGFVVGTASGTPGVEGKRGRMDLVVCVEAPLQVLFTGRGGHLGGEGLEHTLDELVME